MRKPSKKQQLKVRYYIAKIHEAIREGERRRVVREREMMFLKWGKV